MFDVCILFISRNGACLGQVLGVRDRIYSILSNESSIQIAVRIFVEHIHNWSWISDLKNSCMMGLSLL